MKLYSHNRFSEGAKAFSAALRVKRLKHGPGTSWRPRTGDKVINWGASTIPDFGPATIINRPDLIRRCSNKLTFFQTMAAVVEEDRARVPDWTTDPVVARDWIIAGSEVVCRTLLTSHSGRGIIIAKVENELVNAPLYVRYVKKQAEYRVHLIRGRNGATRVVDVQRKIRDPQREPTDWSVRSHANGFIFVRENVELPADAQAQSILAFNASGLDFGAVDVIVNGRSGLAYVLEINTAPGLTGTTVDNYAAAFREAFF